LIFVTSSSLLWSKRDLPHGSSSLVSTEFVCFYNSSKREGGWGVTVSCEVRNSGVSLNGSCTYSVVCIKT
jgi:hypothetical protein